MIINGKQERKDGRNLRKRQPNNVEIPGGTSDYFFVNARYRRVTVTCFDRSGHYKAVYERTSEAHYAELSMTRDEARRLAIQLLMCLEDVRPESFMASENDILPDRRLRESWTIRPAEKGLNADR